MIAASRLSALAGSLDAIRRHPRHVVLFAFAAGLICGPLAPAAVLAAAAVAAALGGRAPIALVAAVAVLAGGALAQARVAALGPGLLPQLADRRIEARAILLEPVRVWRSGTAVARVRIVGAAVSGRGAAALDGGVPDRGDAPGSAVGSGPAPQLAGEVAVVRAEDGRAPPGARVGSELLVRGRIAPLADFEDYQRRRRAHAAIEAFSWTATGRVRGGLAGALDTARERAARGLGSGLRAPEAALLRGMVLGQDEAIEAQTKTDFQRSGLAHLLSSYAMARTRAWVAPRRRPSSVDNFAAG